MAKDKPTAAPKEVWHEVLDELGTKFTKSHDHDDETTRKTKGQIIDAIKKGYADTFGEPYSSTGKN